MRDILVRLAYTHPACSCGAWHLMPHEELCMVSLVREAEEEILRLRALCSKYYE
jgi:hypothetical protein